jgi:stage II sporulation protein D
LRKYILFFFIVSLKPFVAGAAVPKIRVRVKKSLSEIYISGIDMRRKMFVEKDAVNYRGLKKLRFKCKKRFSKKGSISPVLLASLSSQTGLITLKNEKYQGDLSIFTSETGKNCDVINKISLESYLSTLLSKEMNSGWPLEVLKAQAVAARTYALYKIKSKERRKKLGTGKDDYYDIESSEKHQVSGNFFDSTKETEKATDQTNGEVLIGPKGNMSPIFFHAKCGGRTLRPDQVWSHGVAGYEGVDCPFCKKRGINKIPNWSKKISRARFLNFLKWFDKEVSKKSEEKDYKKISFKVAPDRIDKSNLRLYRDGSVVVFDKSLLRRYFGRQILPSNRFKVSMRRSALVIAGKGSGHGVGMCQLGALQMANLGENYKDILKHYFPNHKLKKIY